jgi:hypothetical protein
MASIAALVSIVFFISCPTAGGEDFESHVTPGLGPFVVLRGQDRADEADSQKRRKTRTRPGRRRRWAHGTEIASGEGKPYLASMLDTAALILGQPKILLCWPSGGLASTN